MIYHYYYRSSNLISDHIEPRINKTAIIPLTIFVIQKSF